MSFLNSSTETFVSVNIPAHITKTQILSFLHNGSKMILLNPNLKTHTALSPEQSKKFFSTETASATPSPEAQASIPVYSVSEDLGSGRGWAKRFVPETITCETSIEARDAGMRSVTHAPMGVWSESVWLLKEVGDGLLLEERGKVTSNRMLMAFIKGTIQGEHEKLVKDFMAAVEKEAAGGEIVGEGAKQEEEAVETVS